MKTFLTFFVLLFSSSVFATNDLTGKQIVCGKMFMSEIYITGLNFISPNKVEYYYYENNKFIYHSDIPTLYKTNFKKIFLFFEDEPDNIFWEIDRKYLSVKRPSSSGLLYKSGECSVYSSGEILIQLEETKNKIVNDETKDNKI